MTAQTSALAEIRRGIVNVAVPHHEPPATKRRRRVVVAIVLLLGAGVLGLALRRHPGEPSFYWLSLVLAAVWAIGAFVSGPLHLGGVCWRGRNQRPVISGIVIGLLLGAVFVVGGLIAREIPAVSELITRVLQYTDQGSWRLTMALALVGGIAEELFYRGALYTALGRYHPALVSTIVYVAATRDPVRLAPMGWIDDVTAVSLDASYPESARSAFAAAGPVDVVYYLGYHTLAGESGAHD